MRVQSDTQAKRHMPVRAAPPDPPAIVAAVAAAVAAGRSGCDAEELGSRGRIRSGRALTGPLIRPPAKAGALPKVLPLDTPTTGSATATATSRLHAPMRV